MTKRTGERVGWTLGWLGSLSWIPILAGVLLYREQTVFGMVGLALFVAGVAGTLALAPWHHPTLRCWKLMAPLHLLLLASILWAVIAFDASVAAGMSPWNLLVLLPLLAPYATMGRRCWRDGDEDPQGPRD